MLIKWTKRAISLAIWRSRYWHWKASCKDYRNIKLANSRNTVILIQGIINRSRILQDLIHRAMIHLISREVLKNFTNHLIDLRILHKLSIKNQWWAERLNYQVRERLNMKRRNRILKRKCLSNRDLVLDHLILWLDRGIRIKRMVLRLISFVLFKGTKELVRRSISIMSTFDSFYDKCLFFNK